MTFDEFAKVNDEIFRERFPVFARMPPDKLAGVVSRVVTHSCRLLRRVGNGESIDLDELRHEFGETLIVSEFLCRRLGVTLEECLTHRHKGMREEIGGK